MNRDLVERIVNDFGFHPATDITRPKHELVRRQCRALAAILIDTCPSSRELSLALTHLEEVMFWSNAAIARNEAPLE